MWISREEGECSRLEMVSAQKHGGSNGHFWSRCPVWREKCICVCVFRWRGMKGVGVGRRVVEEEKGRGNGGWWVAFDKVLEEVEESGYDVIGS